MKIILEGYDIATLIDLTADKMEIIQEDINDIISVMYAPYSQRYDEEAIKLETTVSKIYENLSEIHGVVSILFEVSRSLRKYISEKEAIKP